MLIEPDSTCFSPSRHHHNTGPHDLTTKLPSSLPAGALDSTVPPAHSPTLHCCEFPQMFEPLPQVAYPGYTASSSAVAHLLPITLHSSYFNQHQEPDALFSSLLNLDFILHPLNDSLANHLHPLAPLPHRPAEPQLWVSLALCFLLTYTRLPRPAGKDHLANQKFGSQP